jgi:hypothetical protein
MNDWEKINMGRYFALLNKLRGVHSRFFKTIAQSKGKK